MEETDSGMNQMGLVSTLSDPRPAGYINNEQLANQ